MATEPTHEFSVSIVLPVQVLYHMRAQYVESPHGNFELWLGLQLEYLARVRYAEPEPVGNRAYPAWLTEGIGQVPE